jgi:large subunit ribosomal protein L15
MNLSDVCQIKVHRKKRKRVGRGQGSGWGTTSGRGNKGAGSRTGTKDRLRFEGGQMPLYRRLPKKGFTNAPFKVAYHVVNVGDLEAAFSGGAVVDLAAVKAVGFAPKNATYLKVLGFGELKKSLTVKAHGLSAGARAKIEGAKGTVEIVSTSVVHRPKGAPRPEGAGGARRGGERT